MTYIDNFCVGCETCYCCGRDKDVKVYECDRCGDTSLNEDFLERYDFKYLCKECIDELENEDEEDDEEIMEA